MSSEEPARNDSAPVPLDGCGVPSRDYGERRGKNTGVRPRPAGTLGGVSPRDWRRPPPATIRYRSSPNVIGKWEILYGLTRSLALLQRSRHGDAEAAVPLAPERCRSPPARAGAGARRRRHPPPDREESGVGMASPRPGHANQAGICMIMGDKPAYSLGPHSVSPLRRLAGGCAPSDPGNGNGAP